MIDEPRSKVGIFGGTFNPPHLAHLIAAEWAATELGLDQVLFIPANIPPHKLALQDIAEPSHRLAMTALAVASNPKFDVSDAEISRSGTSFTIDTIRDLSASQPQNELFLLIGMDNLTIFNSWHRSNDISDRANVIAIARPGETPNMEIAGAHNVRILTIPLLTISSTLIRTRLRTGLSIRYLVPDSVGAYIEEHQLYKGAA